MADSVGLAFEVKMANPYLVGTIQIPSTLEITAITQAYPAVATVSVDDETASNTYQQGQLVKLTIPFGYGMQQANGLVVKVIGVSDSEVTLEMDTRAFDAFSVPASGEKPASMAPYGSRNLQYSNDTNRISFQSLNNRGN